MDTYHAYHRPCRCRARCRDVEDASGFCVLRESEATCEAHLRAEMISVSTPAGLDFCES